MATRSPALNLKIGVLEEDAIVVAVGEVLDFDSDLTHALHSGEGKGPVCEGGVKIRVKSGWVGSGTALKRQV